MGFPGVACIVLTFVWSSCCSLSVLAPLPLPTDNFLASIWSRGGWSPLLHTEMCGTRERGLSAVVSRAHPGCRPRYYLDDGLVEVGLTPPVLDLVRSPCLASPTCSWTTVAHALHPGPSVPLRLGRGPLGCRGVDDRLSVSSGRCASTSRCCRSSTLTGHRLLLVSLRGQAHLLLRAGLGVRRRPPSGPSV